MKITEDIRQTIFKRFNDGETMTSLAKIYGVSRQHISRILSNPNKIVIGGNGKQPKYLNTRRKSNKCGEYDVISYRNGMYKIKFVNTCSEIDVDVMQVKQNTVFDHYAPTFMDFGILGESYGKAKQSPVFSTWQHMIDRCFNTRNKRHEGYTPDMICDEWANFTTFEEEVKEIPFYEQRIKEGGNKWNLDKDILGQRRYSKNTCLWIPQAMNVHIAGIYRMIDMGFNIEYPTREQIIEYIKLNYVKE